MESQTSSQSLMIETCSDGTLYTDRFTQNEDQINIENGFASNQCTSITFNNNSETHSTSISSTEILSPFAPIDSNDEISSISVSELNGNNSNNTHTYEITNDVFDGPDLQEVKVDFQLSPSLAVVTTTNSTTAQISLPCNALIGEENIYISVQPSEGRPNWDQRETVRALLKEKGITKDILMKILDENEPGEQEAISSSNQSSLESEEDNVKCNNTQLQKDEDEAPGPLANELLQQEPLAVAKVIKSYMTQNNVLQRELVEATNLNQSHLSQHFNRGTPMKTSKRVKLYNWFERHQIRNRQEPSAPSTSQSAKRRRPRWKWSNIAIQILTEAYKKNRFPTREQRLELSRICNEAEQAIAEDRPWNIPDGEWERINETRIYTWFTNKRKLESRQDMVDFPMMSATSAKIGHIGQDTLKIKREVSEIDTSTLAVNDLTHRTMIPTGGICVNKVETAPLLLNKMYHYPCNNLH